MNEFWTTIANWFVNLWNSIVSIFVTGTADNSKFTLLGRILVAVVVFAVFYNINRLVILLMRRGVKRDKNANGSVLTTKSFIISSINAVLMIILVAIVMAILGFDLTGLSTIISSAILAIGVSLQNVIANFASGIIIVTTKIFVVGDYISVNPGEAGEIQGTVKEVNILMTKLISMDNVVIYVPNYTLTSNNVQNYNVMEYRIISTTISVDYSSKPSDIKKILIFVASSEENVRKDMPITAVLKSLNSSSLDFLVRCYVPTSVYLSTMYDLNEKYFEELTKRNVVIPYNKLDVNLYNSTNKPLPVNTDDISDANHNMPKNTYSSTSGERGEGYESLPFSVLVAKGRKKAKRKLEENKNRKKKIIKSLKNDEKRLETKVKKDVETKKQDKEIKKDAD